MNKIIVFFLAFVFSSRAGFNQNSQSLLYFKDTYRVRVIDSHRFAPACTPYPGSLYTCEQVSNLIDNQNYIPVATADELDNLRNTTSQTMGAGSFWEGTYTTGLDKKYVQVFPISLLSKSNWQALLLASNSVYDGNDLLVSDIDISQNTSGYGLFDLGANNNIFLRNIKADGSLTSPAQSTGIIAGRVPANCFIEDCEISGTITQASSAGRCGAVGTLNGTMRRCKSSVVVNVTDPTTTYHGSLVGLCGGLIENSYATGNVTADQYVGGLVGGVLSGTISNCYSVGAVVGNANVGGLVGLNSSGSYNNSYYDTNTSGQSDTGKGTPKTTTQMKQQATFIGWDFTGTWDIQENVTYPFLR